MKLASPIYRRDLGKDTYSEHNLISPSDFIRDNFGVVLTSPVAIDGKIHRFAPIDSRDKDGWYVFSEVDGIVFGKVGDWRLGKDHDKTYRPVGNIPSSTLVRMAERQREQEEEQQKAKDAALAKFYKEWEILPSCIDHPYLARKCVKVYGDLRLAENQLVIPLYSSEGKLVNRQAITDEGQKYFGRYLEVAGARFVIQGSERTFLCEGYATGASIHEATGATVVVCFSGGNLKKVATDYPMATVIADNDKSGAGEKYAQDTNLPYILIPEIGDANDYAQKYGVQELAKLLGEEKKESWSQNIEDFISDLTPPSWLIDRVLPDGQSYVMMFGSPACGKSFVGLSMMMSIAYGTSWYGRKVKQGGVFYILGEGKVGMKRRITAWLTDNGLRGEPAQMNITSGPKDFFNPSDRIEIIKEIDSLPYTPRLVVIDTLNRCFSGNENDSQDIHHLNDAIGEIQNRYGCNVLIIHHTGVSSEAQDRVRGSSAIKGALDTELKVSKQDGVITLTQTKQKDLEPLEDMHFTLRNVDIYFSDGTPLLNEDGSQVHSAVLDEGVQGGYITREQKALFMLLSKVKKESDTPSGEVTDMGDYWRCSMQFLLDSAESFFLGVDGVLPSPKSWRWIRTDKGGAYTKLFPKNFITMDDEGFRRIAKIQEVEE